MQDIMLDIETLGTDSNSIVVSISAVMFDLATGEIGETFEAGLKLKEQLPKGAVLDPDTVMWWLKQPKEAQQKLTALSSEPIGNALNRLNSWLITYVEQLNSCRLWGNGAVFDNVIVRNLYKRHDLDFVVPFWCDNDVRTLVSLAGIDTRDYVFEGTKHYGVDDCKHQIKYCVDAYRRLQS